MGPSVIGEVLVDFEKLEDPPHWPAAVRDREDPAVAPRVPGGAYYQTDAARVDERQLVAVQQHGLMPLAQRSEALRDHIDRGEAPWRPSAAARQSFGEVEYFLCSPNMSANTTGDPRRYIGVS